MGQVQLDFLIIKIFRNNKMSASNILSLLILASPFALANIEIEGKEYRDKVFMLLTVAFGLNILRYLYSTLTLKQFYKGAYLRLAGDKNKNLVSFDDTKRDGFGLTSLKTIFLLPGIVGEQLLPPPSKLLFYFGILFIPFIIGLSVYYHMKLEGKDKKESLEFGIGIGFGSLLLVLLVRFLTKENILIS